MEWLGLQRALNDKLELNWQGSLEWKDDPQELESMVTDLSSMGYPIRLISKAQLAAIEPMLKNPPSFAAFSEAEGAMNAPQVCETLLAAMQEAGGELRAEVKVLSLDRQRQGFQIITASGETLYADGLVLAGGIANTDLAGQLDYPFPMQNRPGVLIRTRPVQARLNHLLLTPTAHFRQQSDGTLLAGEDFGGGDQSEDLHALAEGLLQRIEQRINVDDALTVEELLYGVRPVPEDGLPAVGFVEQVPGLYLAAMHSGVTLGALVGRIAAQEILTGNSCDLLQEFRPDRFVT